MAEDSALLAAAGRIADGEDIDWASITSTLSTPEDLKLADELALVAQIAAGHRQLHELLPIAPDTPANLVPDRARWGHLDLLNVVGRGSYGMVYRAWDTRLERLVALKLFHGAANPDEVMQEGRMLARMRHENVVTVYGADVFDGTAGIWMELVHGRTLDNQVKGIGPLEPREAAAVGTDIARALGAVHGAGLLHCDVKAQNVVRESAGRVVLMDFGAGRLAPEARDSDQLTDVAGTPRYMAPELFVQGNTATRSSDIYSFGVLLYFLVSGRYPVDGKTLGELRHAHAAGNVHALDKVQRGLPKAFVELVTRALDPDPAKRPESALEMEAALQALAKEPAKSVVRSNPWLAVLPTLAVLVIALLMWLTRPATPVAPLPDMNTLAVLPTRNLTGDPSKQYLADGLTEVLNARLARLAGLEVASSASIAAMQGQTANADRAVAEKLGVRLLLAGSVVEANDRIRLSVRLDDPFTGRSIWGTEIERAANTILSARAEIASLLAARLSLSVPSPTATDARQLQPEARELFLRGVVAAAANSVPRLQEATTLFERAVALEPNWAEALGHLASTQQVAAEFGNPAERAARAEIVRANALRAIELDPAEPVSYAALAAVQAYNDWDFTAAEKTLRQAIEADPRNGATHSRLAMLLAARNRLPEAIVEAERARDLDPILAERHGSLGVVRYYARDFDGALDDMRRATQASPGFTPSAFFIGRILVAMGQVDAGIRQMQTVIDATQNAQPGWIANLAAAYALAGKDAEVDRLRAQLRKMEAAGTYISLDQYAYMEANSGNADEAFRLLDAAVTRRMTNVLWLAVDPQADRLRTDQRFDNLIARMGVVSK